MYTCIYTYMHNMNIYTGIYIINIGLHLMMLDEEKSLDKFKELYYSCSVQEKLTCLESEISNHTLLFRLVI